MQQAGISGDEFKQHALEPLLDFHNIVGVEEFKDSLAADGEDSAERSEIGSEYSGGHKITVKGSSLHGRLYAGTVEGSTQGPHLHRP